MARLTITQKLEKISPRLRRGDLTKIANATGYELSHVSRVLRGKRGPTARIVSTAYDIVKSRKVTAA